MPCTPLGIAGGSPAQKKVPTGGSAPGKNPPQAGKEAASQNQGDIPAVALEERQAISSLGRAEAEAPANL